MLSRTFWTRLETQEFIHLYTSTNKQNFILRGVGGGGWGGKGYSTKFYTGKLGPEVQPLTIL